MDHPSYCAGTCKDAAMQTASGDWLCMGCGLSLEARKARQRKVVMPLPVARARQAAIARHPSVRAKQLFPDTVPAPPKEPAPEPQTVPCTTCEKGRVGVARFDRGEYSCTRCKPLRLVAVGLNKAAEEYHLAVSPEQAASARRRP